MVNPFICGCGSGSFHRQAEEDGEIFTPCSTPRSKHRRSSFKSKDVKNPYADRGLDKFSKLLAELEEKKQKIYTQKGSEKISFVRFSYSSSNDLKPIVVRMRARQPEKSCAETKEKYPVEFSSSAKDQASTKDLGDHEDTSEKKMMKKKKKGFSRKMLMEKLSRPSYYLPAVLVLMFVFLALFGRSFAVMCTSILWYSVPIIQKSSSNSRRPRKKKDLARRASEKTINIRHVNANNGLTSSPTSVLGGAIVDDFSPRSHGHRRSF